MWELARELADLLHGAGFATIVPFTAYAALEKALFDGAIDAAWGPPLVCARVEAAGGTVALRGVRAGQVTYRSVLLARSSDHFDLTSLTAGAFRPRAVWVDQFSMAGYILPRAHLRSAGVDLARNLLNERTLGSYRACIDAVLAYDADLCASYLNHERLEMIWGERALRLKILATTDETPNDGIVFAPSLDRARTLELIKRLHTVLDHEPSHALLAKMLAVDGFERPPRDTYTPLLALL